MTHDELVTYAAQWVQRSGVPLMQSKYTIRRTASFVLTELMSIAGESPDVFAFINTIHSSVILEIKTSSADFRSGLKKSFRQYPEQGMGKFRFYFTEKGTLTPVELPEKWGLLEYDGNIVRTTKHAEAFTEYNWRNEQKLMASALRRLNKRGLLDTIYDHPNTKYEIKKIK